jgi:hypothetical protein
VNNVKSVAAAGIAHNCRTRPQRSVVSAVLGIRN